LSTRIPAGTRRQHLAAAPQGGVAATRVNPLNAWENRCSGNTRIRSYSANSRKVQHATMPPLPGGGRGFGSPCLHSKNVNSRVKRGTSLRTAGSRWGLVLQRVLRGADLAGTFACYSIKLCGRHRRDGLRLAVDACHRPGAEANEGCGTEIYGVRRHPPRTEVGGALSGPREAADGARMTRLLRDRANRWVVDLHAEVPKVRSRWDRLTSAYLSAPGLPKPYARSSMSLQRA
jgi:hypothetical protein